MKESKIIFWGIISLLIPALSFGQTDSLLRNDFELENLIEDNTAGNNSTSLSSYLQDYKSHPVDINRADYPQLKNVPFMDYYTAEIILAYRQAHGPFTSLSQLRNITEIDRDILSRIMPFLSVSSYNGTKAARGKDYQLILRSRITGDLQESRGIRENIYAGNSLRTYNRMKLVLKELFSAGLLAEKDAGEKSYADMFSFFASAANIGYISRIIAGDYIIESGEGLVSWSSYDFSSGGDVVQNAVKNERGIIPYSGSGEHYFLRGLAMTATTGAVSLSPFISYRSTDASIDTISSLVKSIDTDGYHRTEGEIRKRNALRNFTYGTKLTCQPSKYFRLALFFIHSEFDHPLYIKSAAYKIFNHYSFSYKALLGNYSVSGETAVYRGLLAYISSLDMKLTNDISAVISFRNYPSGFAAFYSYSFGSSSGKTENENGVYAGLRARTAIGRISVYYDQYRFPKATYDNPFPSKGNSFFLDYETRILKKTDLNFRYKLTQKEVLVTEGTSRRIVNRSYRNIKLEAAVNITKYLAVSQRVDLSFLSRGNLDETGYSVYDNIRYRLWEKLTVTGRIIFFNTGSYQSGIYEYEPDVPGSVSNHTLYGKGMRWFLLVNYKIGKSYSVAMKYSELYKPGEKTMKSGYDEIEGGFDNRLSLQADIAF
ncbi:MAG: ComEA family DNA-binding protein [Bacteroidota bacterium]